jgi:deoxyribodipyrimidine photolyase-related protein
MELTLVFPHQLFDPHPAIATGREVFLVEDPLFFGPDPQWPLKFHVQKLVLHRASMKTFARALESKGHKVRYLDCPRDNDTDTVALLDDALPAKASTVHLCDPVDDVLHRRLQRFAGSRGLKLKLSPSPGFLSPDEWMHETLDGMKTPRMASFYSAQRRRMDILMADGRPVGGKWSFDEENRKKLPRGFEVPAPPRANTTGAIKEALDYVGSTFPDARGSAGSFAYPVSHQSAGRWLDKFLEERFSLFGDYEDALSAEHRVIFHSVLTPALNIGLLGPRQVVDRALQAATEHDIPLNSLEGFIRQIIGWREFMRAMYVRHGVESRSGNFWGFSRPLPDAFYDASTGIPPVDALIRNLHTHAYAHHIERLMVLGNFMMLCRIHPTEVYKWFMEMFIDAYDWVMVPNVYGMSQFADGGTFTTKPYLSGSNYLRKMSDYQKGGWCETWDGLFWTFIDDHREVFEANPRMGMMANVLKRMDSEKLKLHRNNASDYLHRLHGGS